MKSCDEFEVVVGAKKLRKRKTIVELYNKLKPFLSLEVCDLTEPRPMRCVVVDGEQCALRWNPKGEKRPTREQFLQAYNLKEI